MRPVKLHQKHNTKYMKKICLVIALVGIGFAVSAQQNSPKKDNYPYWTISKGAAQMQFKNVEYVPAKITVGDPSWTIAKGPAQLSAKNRKPGGRIITTGYPTWVISKGAARMQVENGQSK